VSRHHLAKASGVLEGNGPLRWLRRIFQVDPLNVIRDAIIQQAGCSEGHIDES
jgi:alkyl hydroperoxide reductase subunit AhpC